MARFLLILSLASLAAGCTGPAEPGAPQPLRSALPWDAIAPDPAAQPSGAPVCEGVRWVLDPGTLRAGDAASIALQIVNPCSHSVQLAHSIRQPTLWVEQGGEHALIFQAELVRSSFLELPAGGSRAWAYDWTPTKAGDATLRLDVPDLLREYQGLRLQGFGVQIS